ncbi:hypothetical protein LEMA_P121850.1 [Plenodomus lingam JN3]|uniref:Ig-like domain-containing protein n=1 Tax=Leptosphaeria maculans (strain JN3 / isolate v23.1.3 / race Av1-4-5-6-7-8) TaxID=985895 RepID=E4ZSP1_LEPMJ|nr:hypothetical protein LEMA_P121850.1 [Plenodomus lingam JN3]CBX94421.1 hypothetical protein LEMA_P121850.1 [Plenodomus lingam JN3]
MAAHRVPRPTPCHVGSWERANGGASTTSCRNGGSLKVSNLTGTAEEGNLGVKVKPNEAAAADRRECRSIHLSAFYLSAGWCAGTTIQSTSMTLYASSMLYALWWHTGMPCSLLCPHYFPAWAKTLKLHGLDQQPAKPIDDIWYMSTWYMPTIFLALLSIFHGVDPQDSLSWDASRRERNLAWAAMCMDVFPYHIAPLRVAGLRSYRQAQVLSASSRPHYGSEERPFCFKRLKWDHRLGVCGMGLAARCPCRCQSIGCLGQTFALAECNEWAAAAASTSSNQAFARAKQHSLANSLPSKLFVAHWKGPCGMYPPPQHLHYIINPQLTRACWTSRIITKYNHLGGVILVCRFSPRTPPSSPPQLAWQRVVTCRASIVRQVRQRQERPEYASADQTTTANLLAISLGTASHGIEIC